MQKFSNFFKTFQRSFSFNVIDQYYKKEFTNNLNFIESNSVRMPLFRVMDLEGNILNKKYENIEAKDLLNLYDIMLKVRSVDEVYLNAQRMGKINFYMTGKYEESANLGVVHGIQRQDTLFLQYRENPMFFYRGLTTYDYLMNCAGNSKDLSKGRGFPLMISDPKLGVFSMSGPLGNRTPQCPGAGFFYRVNKENKISVAVFGEGSASEGDFHAGLNFAAALRSQSMFVCRNNIYAISTFIDDQYKGDGVSPRGIGYGMPCIKVDGCDLFAVYNAVKLGREIIMNEKIPVLIELHAYRFLDHSTSDSAASYRTPEKMKQVNPYIDSL